MSNLSYSKEFAGVADVFLRTPERYLPLMQFVAAIMEGDMELARPQREMIALRVSRENNCPYCIGAHRAALEVMGVDSTLLDQVEAAAGGNDIDPSMRAALKFATALAVAPANIKPEHVNEMLDAGWNEQAVEDVICIVSTFLFFNRFANGFGFHGSPDYFAQVGPMLAQGYTPLVDMIKEKAAATV